jgi:hypothetical protein
LVGTLLSDVGSQRVAHIPHTSVVQELAVCFEKGRPVELFSVGFGFHDHNLKSGEVSSMFKRLGVKDLWDKLGENASLAFLLGTTGTDLTPRQARSFLDEFVEVRNQVMHRGPNYNTVGGTVLLEYVGFFRCFVPALADLLSNHAASFP